MIRHILNYLPSKLIPGAINFFLLLIYSRVFTTLEYGRYAYIFAIAVFVQSIFYPWFRLSVIRFLKKYSMKGEESKYLHFTYYIFIQISLLFAILWLIMIPILKPDGSMFMLMLLALPMVITTGLFELFQAISRAKLESSIYSLYRVLNTIIKFIFVLLFAYVFKFDEKSILVGIIISNLISIWIYLKRKIHLDVKLIRNNKNYKKEMLKYGIPLTFTFVLLSIITSTDRVMLDYFLGKSAVALYSLPYDITAFTLTNIFMIFNLAYFPVVIKEMENNNLNKTIRRVSEYQQLLLFFSIPVLSIFIIYAPEIARLIIGQQYFNKETILLIRFVSIAIFLSGWKAYYFDLVFHLSKNTKKQIIPVIFASVINIILNFILIPLFGLAGAAYSTIIAYFISILISYVIGRRILKLPLVSKGVFRIFIINILFFIVAIFLKKLINSDSMLLFIFHLIVAIIIYLILTAIFHNKIISKFVKKKRMGG